MLNQFICNAMAALLYTKRLSLRAVRPDDVEQVHALHMLPETDRYNALGIPESIGETKSVIDKWLAEANAIPQNGVSYIIENISDKSFVGIAGLKFKSPKYETAEVWYKMHKDAWGKGYATETLKSIIGYCFETLQLHRVEAGCAVENIASYKVMEKAGMLREGRKRKALPLKSGWADNYFYAILKEEWLNAR